MKKILFLLPFCAAVSAQASSDAYYNYLRGLVDERSGNMAKALSDYEKVVAEDPQAVEAYRDIAQLNMRMGQTGAALQAAEKVKELAPQDPSSYLFLGNVYVAQGNLTKAAESYEQALKLDPNNLRALENLGNYYAILDPNKALPYYKRYLEINPKDAEIHFQTGLLHQRNGKIEDATRAYKTAIDMEPQQLAPHLALAELYELQKSTDDAIKEYMECAKIAPQNAQIFMRIGRLAYDSQRWDQAEEAFKNVSELEPKEPAAYYWLARIAEEHKQWAEAAKYAEKAHTLGQDVQFLPLLAYYLTLDHRVKEAVVWLEKARKKDPTNANVLLFLGMDYLDLNQPEKSQEILKKAVELHPEDPQLHFQLGITEDHLQHFDAAVVQFQEVLKLDPDNAASMNYLGYSWADRGVHLDEAEKLLRRAVALEPQSGAFLDSLGWVRYKRGDTKEAISLLEKAVQASPDPLIYDHLGDAYLADQKPDLALDAWKKSLAMDPKNAQVQKKVQEGATRVIPGTDQRKYLKYIEGNYRQVSDLGSAVSVQAKWKKQPVKTQGQFYYVKPDQLIFDVAVPDKAQAMRLLVSGRSIRWEPPALQESMKSMPVGPLQSLPLLFSGDLTAPLDNSEVKTDSGTAGIHYSGNSQEAWVDPARGVLTRFKGPNPNGGRDDIEWIAYDFVEGIWLPKELRWRNPALGWDAHLKFSRWVVNDPGNKQPFKK